MNKLNSMPWKIYGFKTPNYLFSKYICENKLAFSGWMDPLGNTPAFYHDFAEFHISEVLKNGF